jgi:hypothetical protein
MGMLSVQRNDDALPSSVWGNHLDQEGHPLPTNSWYLVSCAALRYAMFRSVIYHLRLVSIRFHSIPFDLSSVSLLFVCSNPLQTLSHTS